jgi:hypothetical protein
MRKHIFKITGILLFIMLVFLLTACESKPEKDSIVIGASRPLTGPLAIYEDVAFAYPDEGFLVIGKSIALGFN